MPRVTDTRPPAEPSSEGQKARYQRIIEVASELGSQHDFDSLQMQDVATGAEVAIATLYRYFPSKVHLLVAVMRAQVDRVDRARVSPKEGQSPAEAASELLIGLTVHMHSQRRLSLSGIQAMIFAESLENPDRERIKVAFSDIILRLANWNTDPTDDQRRRAWLLTQCWFGVLMQVLNGSRSRPMADADIRRACELLLSGG
ncbi:AcrR family transcriptional regulator [Marmoricola sp. OAE513]|uniref:TetR/AcrR family transcriptional regulator n=1 Tax=Marmoricola sp. OAE513 TaxID=2817894 RepID=UPI001AE81056